MFHVLTQSQKNEIQVTIPTTQLPPSWAEHYRFVCKADKQTYFNVFSNFFYPDAQGGYYWYFLEGDNSSKVEKGDKLRVKVDSEGAVAPCTYTMVLEKEVKASGFIDDGSSGTNPITPPQSGVYMKLLPKGFAANYNTDSTKIIFDGGKTCEKTIGDFPTANGTCNEVLTGSTVYVDYTIPQGSTVSIDIRFLRKGYDIIGLVTCDNYEYEFVKNFTATVDYANFQLFWEAQVAPVINTGNQISSAATISQAYIPPVALPTNPTQPTFYT